MKKDNKIIHVYIKKTDTHDYFGSIAALFYFYSKEQIGITYNSLINYWTMQGDSPYENHLCIIRKAIIKRKPLSASKS